MVVDIDFVELFEIAELLKKAGHKVINCGKAAQAEQVLKTKNSKGIDAVVISAHVSRGENPMHFYARLLPGAEDLPVVVIASKNFRHLALEALKIGAADIVLRERLVSNPARLLDSINYSIIRNARLLELKPSKKKR